jgi:hypothetical protein
VSSRFTAFRDLDADVHTNSAFETIKEYIKTSAKSAGIIMNERNISHGCSRLLHQRKQAKLQCLQHRREINGGNLNNIRCDACRHLNNIKREYLKDKNQ